MVSVGDNIYHIIHNVNNVNDSIYTEFPMNLDFYQPAKFGDMSGTVTINEVIASNRKIKSCLLDLFNSIEYSIYIPSNLLNEILSTTNSDFICRSYKVINALPFIKCNNDTCVRSVEDSIRGDKNINKINTTYNGKLYVVYSIYNPFECLERDYTDKLDIQFNDDNTLVEYVNLSYKTFEPTPKYKILELLRLYISELKMYTTVNTNFHSGDLYQHSVWALLYAEHITSGESEFRNILQIKDNSVRKLTCFISFIHDIGKMVNMYENNSIKYYNGKFIYKGIRKHPKYGAFIMSDLIKLFSTLNGKANNSFDIKYLLLSFGINDSPFIRGIVSMISELHTKFGINVYKEIKVNPNVDRNLVASNFVKLLMAKYITYFGKIYKYFPTFVNILLIVSISDIASMQPYPIYNKVSEFYPFIHNVPKLYKGVNIYGTNKFVDISTDMILIISDIVYKLINGMNIILS